MKIRKLGCLLLSAVMVITLLAGCGGSGGGAASSTASAAEASSAAAPAESKAESTPAQSSEAAPAESSAAEPATEPAAEKTSIAVSLCNNPITLCDWNETRVWVYYFTDMMNGFLVKLNSDGSDFEPDIATDWQISDDGMQIVFNLRDDVYFHNGRKMTADDVTWCMNYNIDEANATAQYAAMAPYVDRIETTGENQVTFFMKEPRPALIETLSYVAIYPQEAMDNIDTNPVGCGPYKFVRWDENQQVVMEKFDQYYDADSIKNDEIVFKFYNEYNAELSALLAGEVQVMTQLANVDIPTIEGQGDKYGFSTSEGNKYYINWNMARDISQNEKLRQAVKYGLDRQQIVDAAFAGLAYKTWQFPATTSTWYYPDLDWEVDKDKAKQLVAESGYAGEEIEFIVPNTTAEGGI